MRVLGVDPGLTRCGVAVVEGDAGRARLIAADVVRTDAKAPVEQRLATLHAALTAALAEHRPDVVACERVLFSANVRTAMAVGQAAGIALLAAAQADLAVVSYSPTDLKLTIAGDGRADKAAIGRLVAAQLGLPRAPEPADAADAIAAALCHLGRARFAASVAAASAR